MAGDHVRLRHKPLAHYASAPTPPPSFPQAQGLVQLMGGSPRFVHQAVRAHNVLLAAHGPYTAAGAASVLGVPITCVSRDSSTFDGLVEALASTLAGRVGSPGMAKALALRRQLQSE